MQGKHVKRVEAALMSLSLSQQCTHIPRSGCKQRHWNIKAYLRKEHIVTALITFPQQPYLGYVACVNPDVWYTRQSITIERTYTVFCIRKCLGLAQGFVCLFLLGFLLQTRRGAVSFSPHGIFTKGYYYERDMFICLEECSGMEIWISWFHLISVFRARFELCYANSNQML